MKDETAAKCPFGFGAEGEATSETGYKHGAVPPALSRDKLPDLVREPIEAGANGLATGRCMCGRVSFQVNKPFTMIFANHDADSRRRSGGVALTFMIRATSTAFNGWGNLVQYAVNERETSCFCRICGTPMFVRHMAPAMDGMLSVSAGVLDSTDGLTLAADICPEEKPDFYSFEGERRAISAAELQSTFG